MGRPADSVSPASAPSARGLAVEWNDAHSAEVAPAAAHKKHKFDPANKDCAELNTDRFADPEMVATDNWVGGFYMEVPAALVSRRPRSQAPAFPRPKSMGHLRVSPQLAPMQCTCFQPGHY